MQLFLLQPAICAPLDMVQRKPVLQVNSTVPAPAVMTNFVKTP